MKFATRPETFRSASTATSARTTRCGTRSRRRPGQVYNWPKSTYIAEPPFFDGLRHAAPASVARHHGRARARHLRRLGHHRPHQPGRLDQGRPRPPACTCTSNGVAMADFNSYGARRGNHEVMMRGTFANVRIKNLMLPGTEGGDHASTSRPASRCRSTTRRCATIAEGMPHGGVRRRGVRHRARRATGRPRAPQLLGVKAVIARSFERIHRSNLVGMGVLPLQFKGTRLARSRSASTATRRIDVARHRERHQAAAGRDAGDPPRRTARSRR